MSAAAAAAGDVMLSVELSGGGPWGFRLGGGADFGIPLEIAKIRKKSKADAAGLQEGDIVTAIDNQDVSKKSHGEAMAIIEAAGSTLRVIVKRSATASGSIPAGSATISVPIYKPVTLIVDGLDGGSSVTSASSRSSRDAGVSIPIEIQHNPPTRARQPPQPVPAQQQPASFSSAPLPPITPTSPWSPTVPGVYQANLPTGWRMNSEVQQTTSSSSHTGGGSNVERKLTIISRAAASLAAAQPPAWNSAAQRPAYGQPQARPHQTPPSTAPLPRKFSSFEPWTIELPVSYSPAVSYKAPIIKSPAFSVKKHDVRRVVWSPTVVSFRSPSDDSAPAPAAYDELEVGEAAQRPLRASSQPPPESPGLDSFDSGERPHASMPAAGANQPAYTIPEPPPLDGFTQQQAARASGTTKKRIPGMVNPLITEHGSGHGGLDDMNNRTTRKKIYSDSSFYDAPGMDYPTVDEQVEMCRRIAVLLDSDRNRSSRGGRMFAKRKETAEQWAIETNASTKPDVGVMSWSYDGASDLSGLPLFQFRNPSFGYNQVRHHPEPIKSHLTAEEVESLKANERCLVKHDSLPPNLAFDVTTALTHSSGKGAKIFAKRRERADKYTIDETNVRRSEPPRLPPQAAASALAPSPASTRLVVQTLAPGRAHLSPWEAALEGNIDRAFEHLNNYKRFEVFEVPVHSALSPPTAPPPAAMTRSFSAASPTAGPPLQGLDALDFANGPGSAIAGASKLRVQYKPFQPVQAPGTGAAVGRQQQQQQPDSPAAGSAAASYQPAQLQGYYREPVASFEQPGGGTLRAKSEPRGAATYSPPSAYPVASGGGSGYPTVGGYPSRQNYNTLPRGFAAAPSVGATYSSPVAGATSWNLPSSIPSSAGVSVF